MSCDRRMEDSSWRLFRESRTIVMSDDWDVTSSSYLCHAGRSAEARCQSDTPFSFLVCGMVPQFTDFFRKFRSFHSVFPVWMVGELIESATLRELIARVGQYTHARLVTSNRTTVLNVHYHHILCSNTIQYYYYHVLTQHPKLSLNFTTECH